MNIKQLIENFDGIIEMPQSVQVLRKFITNIAVRGYLSKQNHNDESTDEIYSKVKKAWEGLLTSGSVKKGSNLETGQVPYQFPDHWACLRLGDVLQMFNGRAFKPIEWTTTGLPIVRIQNLNNPDALFNYCDPSIIDDRFRIDSGDLLISWSGTPGTSFGAFIWQKGPAALNQHIFRCTQIGDVFEPRFLQLVINSQLDVLISQAKGGVGLQHVTRKTLENLSLVVPPRKEQKRIIEKFDEITFICEQFEITRKETEKLRDQFFTSALQRLEENCFGDKECLSKDSIDSEIDNILSLPVRTKHIASIKKSILTFAVKGGFYKEKGKKHTEYHLRSFAKVQNGYSFKSEWFTSAGIKLVRNINVSHGVLRWDNLACLSLERAREFERFSLIKGDIVLSLDRPFINTGTKVAQIRDVDLPSLLVQRVGRIQFDSNIITADYLMMWLESPHFMEQVNPGKSHGVPHISSKQVENATITLPSIAEQIKIVAKAKELISICEKIEEQILFKEKNSENMLESVFEKSIGIYNKKNINSNSIDTAPQQKPQQHDRGASFMLETPASTIEQLLSCLDQNNGSAPPDKLLVQMGLGDEIETFYDLLRTARDCGKVSIKLGENKIISRLEQ